MVHTDYFFASVVLDFPSWNLLALFVKYALQRILMLQILNVSTYLRLRVIPVRGSVFSFIGIERIFLYPVLKYVQINQQSFRYQ